MQQVLSSAASAAPWRDRSIHTLHHATSPRHLTTDDLLLTTNQLRRSTYHPPLTAHYSHLASCRIAQAPHLAPCRHHYGQVVRHADAYDLSTQLAEHDAHLYLVGYSL